MGKGGDIHMSMRVKLFASYLVMGFIPIFLLAAILFGAMYRVVSASPFLTSLDDDGQENILQGIDELLNVELLARNNPEGLFDRELLAKVDQKLAPNHIGILLLDSGKQVFYVSGFLDREALLEEIRQAEQNGARIPGPGKQKSLTVLGYKSLNVRSNFTVLEKKLDNGKFGTYYLAIETGASKEVSDSSAHRFLFFIFSGMAGLILLLTFLVTRGMMQSLRKLEDGVRHISQGDLNFSIRTNRRDEVARVVMAFEEMRLRLKASIDAQVKEDENRKELVANISHDLKTPVTAIKGYVEGLIDGVADTPEKREKYLSTVLGKTVALDRMIDDLFLYSSLDMGRMNYHFDTVPAAEVFAALCAETKLDLSERGFEVLCDVRIPAGVRIKADRQMIHRLQHNLTENASKYCRVSDRKVTFAAFVQGTEVLCSTEDNGIGIKAEELPRIFERFYRADGARTSTVGGTGLGLQISRRIVEDHGGRIWAESSYGEYTRISWTIPLFPADGTPTDGPAAGGSKAGESRGEKHA
jgi:signal transduction histidine kinase